MSSVTKERKSAIVAEYGGNTKNTGSIEAQIALLTEEINEISNTCKRIRKISEPIGD